MKKNKQLNVIGKYLSKLTLETESKSKYYDANKKYFSLKFRDKLISNIMSIRKKRSFLFGLYNAIEDIDE